MASMIKINNNEEALELSIKRLKSDIKTLQVENNQISKSIKIIENENNHEPKSPIKKSSRETRLDKKDTNKRGFDMSRLDKGLTDHEEIESDKETENKAEELLDYEFHFQMVGHRWKNSLTCVMKFLITVKLLRKISLRNIKVSFQILRENIRMLMTLKTQQLDK